MGVESSFPHSVSPPGCSQPSDDGTSGIPSPRNRRRSYREFLLPPLLLLVSSSGCFLLHQTSPETRAPEQQVAYYLQGVFNPYARKDVYDLLTIKTRQAIPYKNFVSLRNAEVARLVGTPSDRDFRVSVSVLDQYNFSSDHSVVYALLFIRYPYSLGERETYRLVRLHCYRQGDRWAIEPFMHAETGTVFFVPTRMRGPFWRISRDMDLVQARVREEIATYEEQKTPPPEKAIFDDSGKESSLVVLDVPETETVESAPQPPAADRKVDALLSIGKLCYEAGRIAAAEDTFRRVLALAPDNPVATDYLSRCENYRLLQKEREGAVRLMEKLLRLESEERSRE